MARVAVIDDDTGMRGVLEEILGSAGHDVSLASSGLAGIALVTNERPDLVLCDVEMPGGCDGYDVLRAIRSDDELRTIPFLFLTGLGGESALRSGMNLGADDYLMKPVTPADLLAAIETRLARSAANEHETRRRLEEMRRSVAVLLPHELRTPLTTILGSAELLQETHSHMTPAQIRRTAGAIVAAGRRLQRMAENYLMYAGLELGRLAGPGGPAPRGGTGSAVDVEEAARATAAAAGREADQRFDLGPVVLPLAGPYVRKIVSELVENAIKFSAAGSPIRVSLATDRGPRLDVTDEGRGMSPEQIAEVGAFRQFDRAFFEQQGSGLGLALVHGIVRASGGALELTSPPGRGTCATVRWPATAP